MVDLDADVVRPRGLARVGARLLGELAVGKEIVAVELEASDGKENLAVAVLRSLAKQMCVLTYSLANVSTLYLAEPNGSQFLGNEGRGSESAKRAAL